MNTKLNITIALDKNVAEINVFICCLYKPSVYIFVNDFLSLKKNDGEIHLNDYLND